MRKKPERNSSVTFKRFFFGFFFSRLLSHLLRKGLFLWRKQGAPADRVTRLGGLKRSPPLNESHLSGKAGVGH